MTYYPLIILKYLSTCLTLNCFAQNSDFDTFRIIFMFTLIHTNYS